MVHGVSYDFLELVSNEKTFECKSLKTLSFDDIGDSFFAMTQELHEKMVGPILKNKYNAMKRLGAINRLDFYNPKLSDNENIREYWKNIVVKSEEVDRWIFFVLTRKEGPKLVSMCAVGKFETPELSLIDDKYSTSISHFCIDNDIASSKDLSFFIDIISKICVKTGKTPTIFCKRSLRKNYESVGFKEIGLSRNYCLLSRSS